MNEAVEHFRIVDDIEGEGKCFYPLKNHNLYVSSSTLLHGRKILF
jgi:hypothetical protein